MEEISVWTDGSSTYYLEAEKKGRAPIGYAAIVDIGEYRWELSAYEPNGTNNTAELKAPILALTALNPAISQPYKVRIHTDSQLVINHAQGNWKLNKNKALVLKLRKILEGHGDVEWEHVKGHTGIPLNERVDELAGEARAVDEDKRRLVETRLIHIPTGEVMLDKKADKTEYECNVKEEVWRLRLRV